MERVREGRGWERGWGLWWGWGWGWVWGLGVGEGEGEVRVEWGWGLGEGEVRVRVIENMWLLSVFYLRCLNKQCTELVYIIFKMLKMRNYNIKYTEYCAQYIIPDFFNYPSPQLCYSMNLLV